MYVGDWVLRAIGAEIAAHPPERGGALLGPPQRPLVTHFLADPDAATTSSSYRPSRALDARVKELEAGAGLELKGIVHSHPRGVDRPSDHDATELATGLRLNGHMARYLAPIVTAPIEGELEPHELPLARGKISFFAGYRMRSGEAEVRACRVRVVPLLGDLERVAAVFGCPVPEPALTDAGNGLVLLARLQLPGMVEVLVLTSEHHPAFPPVLLATAPGGATEQLHPAWRLELPEEERLVAALREAIEPPGPYRIGFGPRGLPLTTDPDRAHRAGWERTFTGRDPADVAARLEEALHTRGAGLLHEALRARRVLVAGCGSVGSYMAEQLARAGVGALTLIDPEHVEAANLSRTPYELTDVGRAKTDALARRLLNVNPLLRVRTHAAALEQLDVATVDEEVTGADLVLATTDDPAAQRILDRFAFGRGRPALFVGLYAGARGGEVIVTDPGRTPCYLCATATRHRAESTGGRVSAETDYGTGRLAGEVALAADIHHVASAGVKLALSLLLRDEPAAALHRVTDDAIAEGLSYLTLATVPRYWFYPALFEGVAGQGAYQAVWLTPTRNPDCPVCGPPERRVDPREVPLRPPGRAAFAAALREPPTREHDRGPP